MNEHIGAEIAGTVKSAQRVPSPMPAGTFVPVNSANRKWLIGGAMALLVIVVAATAWWFMSGGATVKYITASVTRGSITHTVTATGTVNPVLTIIVGTYVSGVIQELNCDYNTHVKRGQICAKIDPRPYQSVVDQSRANLAIAKAQLEKDKASLAYAKINHERQARLFKTKRGLARRSRHCEKRLRPGAGADHIRRGHDPTTSGRTRCGTGQSRLHEHRLPCGWHRRVPQRDHGSDRGGELPDANTVPDRDRSHQNAGRYQCE